jgi:hypothetical protein
MAAESDLIGFDPAALDIVALVSALVATIAVSPLLSFGYDDMVAADARALVQNPSASPTSVSWGLAFWSSTGSSLNAFAVFCAVTVRLVGALGKDLPEEAHLPMQRYLRPVAKIAVVSAAIGIIWWIPALYYVGLVMLPSAVSGGAAWMCAGGWLMLATGFLLVYSLFAFYKVRSAMKAVAHTIGTEGTEMQNPAAKR